MPRIQQWVSTLDVLNNGKTNFLWSVGSECVIIEDIHDSLSEDT